MATGWLASLRDIKSSGAFAMAPMLIHRARKVWSKPKTLAARAADCPRSAGVYRLYCGRRLLHVGMPAGAATLRAEWEAAPDSLFAYRRFVSIYSAATYAASEIEPRRYRAPSSSRRYSRLARRLHRIA